MKSYFKTLICALAVGVLSVGCDDVDEGDRYIKMEAVEVQRAVLLEDFTGQNCVNCPDAHAVIEQLEQLYGENLIAVSIHGGSFGVSVDNTVYPSYVGLAEPEGETYNSAYGVTSWPAGLINRMGSVSEYDKWSAAVRTEIEKPAGAQIDVEAVLSGSTIEISETVHPLADFSGKLQVWVVESGIVAFQRSGSERVPDYVHNNVFRAAVNGEWGEDVTYKDGIIASSTHSIEVRNSDTERWDVDNLAVVVFIYNESGVVQAARAKVVTETETEE